MSEDDYVHFVIQAIERIGTEKFWVNHRGSGSAQQPPHMMMALLIYCYSRGIFSFRKIERATYENVSVRYLTADTHPDHATICKFRSDNHAAISKVFVETLFLAKELKARAEKDQEEAKKSYDEKVKERKQKEKAIGTRSRKIRR